MDIPQIIAELKEYINSVEWQDEETEIKQTLLSHVSELEDRCRDAEDNLRKAEAYLDHVIPH